MLPVIAKSTSHTMRLLLLPAIIIILVNLLVDSYIYGILKRRCDKLWPSRVQLVSALLFQLAVIVAICLPRRGGDNTVLLAVMWTLYSYLTVYVAKYIYVAVDLLSRIPELIHRRRIKWLTAAGSVMAIGVFGAMWWGALINRFAIQVKEVDIPVSDLPYNFDGFRIAQISDLHTGTFGNDTSFVSKLVDKVNSLNPDVIVFTGDIVNSRTSELQPHTSPLSRLHARYGVFSILGNHDYGDYSDWPNEISKQQNMDQLISMQKDMGWRLLLNETEFIHSGTDSIALIGVENIGDPPFKVYGSLTQAYPAVSDSVCKVLLTHNPAHWTDSIANNPAANIALTLSGHTHAMQMQMGSWSPAIWRYDTWGGLYNDIDSTHYLYVNIGDGTVGFPARIGATPEITILTLKKR